VNASNFIYVSDQQNQRIRTISPIGLVGTLTGFLSNGSMDGTLATASLLNPTGLALDHLGHVVFGEQGSNNIRSASFSAVVTIAGCSAPSGFSDGYNFSACFTLPYGIAYDPNNRVIWIADTFNNNVRTLSAIGQVASIAAGTTGGFSDGFFPLIRFTSPRGIATKWSHFCFGCRKLQSSSAHLRPLPSLVLLFLWSTRTLPCWLLLPSELH
jgi:DNA-binding beta-propeller fold protein YncE